MQLNVYVLGKKLKKSACWKFRYCCNWRKIGVFYGRCVCVGCFWYCLFCNKKLNVFVYFWHTRPIGSSAVNKMTATACLRFQLLISIFNDHLKTLCNNKDRTTKHNLSLVKCRPEVKKLLRNTGLPVLLGTRNLVLASTWNHRVVIQRSVSQNTCFSLCKLVLVVVNYFLTWLLLTADTLARW